MLIKILKKQIEAASLWLNETLFHSEPELVPIKIKKDDRSYQKVKAQKHNHFR